MAFFPYEKLPFTKLQYKCFVFLYCKFFSLHAFFLTKDHLLGIIIIPPKAHLAVIHENIAFGFIVVVDWLSESPLQKWYRVSGGCIYELVRFCTIVNAQPVMIYFCNKSKAYYKNNRAQAIQSGHTF